MAKNLRVVAAGGGYFAQFQLRAWERLASTDLVAIVDTDTSRHADLGECYAQSGIFAELQQALASGAIDIVDIITPPSTHLALIKQVCQLAPNALIICQKPFCENLAQARQALALADSHNTTLVVHENFRFQPWYGQIKKILDQGVLGEVLNAQFRLRPGDGQGPNAYLDRQPYFQDMEKFLIHETGIHWIDVFRYLFGEPAAVYADLQQHNPVIKGEDTGYFVFHYESGLRAHFDGNRLLDHAATNPRLTLGSMTIEGTEASLTLDGNGQILQRQRGSAQPTPHQYNFDDTDFGGDCVFHLQHHVVKHLLEGTPLQNTAADYLINVKIEEAIYQSASTRSVHTIEDLAASS